MNNEQELVEISKDFEKIFDLESINAVAQSFTPSKTMLQIRNLKSSIVSLSLLGMMVTAKQIR